MRAAHNGTTKRQKRQNETTARTILSPTAFSLAASVNRDLLCQSFRRGACVEHANNTAAREKAVGDKSRQDRSTSNEVRPIGDINKKMYCFRVGQVIRKAPKRLVVFSAEGVAMLATAEPQVAAASSSVPSVEQS
eukprot:5083086-Pleurochrysis_carterae.AAC.1